MAQETKVEETRCSLQTFERNRYFYRKFMTVRDFVQEQEYFNSKRWMINRLLFGSGIVCGLEVNRAAGTARRSCRLSPAWPSTRRATR